MILIVLSRYFSLMRVCSIGDLLPLAGLPLQSWRVLAAEVLRQDLQESHAELLDSEGVDNGVDGGVTMSEQDGNVDQEQGLLALGAEECSAVDDVEG